MNHLISREEFHATLRRVLDALCGPHGRGACTGPDSGCLCWRCRNSRAIAALDAPAAEQPKECEKFVCDGWDHDGRRIHHHPSVLADQQNHNAEAGSTECFCRCGQPYSAHQQEQPGPFASKDHSIAQQARTAGTMLVSVEYPDGGTVYSDRYDRRGRVFVDGEQVWPQQEQAQQPDIVEECPKCGLLPNGYFGPDDGCLCELPAPNQQFNCPPGGKPNLQPAPAALPELVAYCVDGMPALCRLSDAQQWQVAYNQSQRECERLRSVIAGREREESSYREAFEAEDAAHAVTAKLRVAAEQRAERAEARADGLKSAMGEEAGWFDRFSAERKAREQAQRELDEWKAKFATIFEMELPKAEAERDAARSELATAKAQHEAALAELTDALSRIHDYAYVHGRASWQSACSALRAIRGMANNAIKKREGEES